METKTLNNGVEIPVVGYGTWQTPSGEVAVAGVKHAIEAGYRHIDTAAVYENEPSVGAGIAKALASGVVTREELFVTSKVWNTERGYETTLTAFEKTLSDLGLDYLDLYLIHWPANAKQFDRWEEINLETWRAMTDLYQAGKIRAIGVSNFKPHHLEALMQTEVKPAVNQIEYHPGFLQSDIVDYCKANDIVLEAWSPLGTGEMLTNETLQEIASKYDKSVAQLCIRFCLQNDLVPLPKSVTPERIEENLEVFDFEIADEDMARIEQLPEFGTKDLDPDEIDF